MKLSNYASRKPPRVPRWLLFRAAVTSMSLGGCVSATAYEQARSAAQVESEGHRMAAAKLETAQAELAQTERERDQLQATATSLKSQIEEGEQQLAQANLDAAKIEKAHEQDVLLVTQLRGELARVGEHLKSYAGDKNSLEAQHDVLLTQLAEKDRRILLLEAEVAGLKDNLSNSKMTSEKAQQELDGALSELAGLEQEVAAKKPAAIPTEESAESKSKPDESRPEDDPERSTSEHQDSEGGTEGDTEIDDESADVADSDDAAQEDESIYEPPEEVKPSEEAE